MIVKDDSTGRPIEDATVTTDKNNVVTVTLPDGRELDKNNQVSIVILDNQGKPAADVDTSAKNDLNNRADGTTDDGGLLILPVPVTVERHDAYIVGYPDGTFGPSRNMTRSEAAAIFARLLAKKNGDTLAENAATKFSDVPADAWYSGYVRYLSNNGIVKGVSDKLFCPNAPITRAEFVVMAVRFFDAYGDGTTNVVPYSVFEDVTDGYWAAEYIENAAEFGWVIGYEDGTFRPTSSITRAEVVTIVNRVLNRTADQEYVKDNLRYLNTFTDMGRSHWAYYAVMEAANSHTATYLDTEEWSR